MPNAIYATNKGMLVRLHVRTNIVCACASVRALVRGYGLVSGWLWALRVRVRAVQIYFTSNLSMLLLHLQRPA